MFNVLVASSGFIIYKFKVHMTILNLPGCGCNRKIDDKLKRCKIKNGNQREQLPKRLKVNYKVMVHQCQITPSVSEAKKRREEHTIM